MVSIKKRKDYDNLLLYNLFGNICLERGIFVLCLLDKGMTVDAVAVWQSLLNLGMFLGEIPTGFFADIIGKKRSLLFGKLLIVLYYLILLFSNNLILIYISAFAYGIGSTFISGTDEALLYEIILKKGKKENTADILGRFSAVTIAITGISMLAGGFIQELGWSILLVICIIGQFMALYFLGQISKTDAGLARGDKKKTLSTYIQNLKHEMKHKEILMILFALGINEGIISALYILAQDELQKYGVRTSSISVFLQWNPLCLSCYYLI